MSWALVLIVIMPNDPYYGGTIEKTIMHFTDKKDCEEVAADLETKGSIKLGRIRSID
jgi:Ribonuclease G/E